MNQSYENARSGKKEPQLQVNGASGKSGTGQHDEKFSHKPNPETGASGRTPRGKNGSDTEAVPNQSRQYNNDHSDHSESQDDDDESDKGSTCGSFLQTSSPQRLARLMCSSEDLCILTFLVSSILLALMGIARWATSTVAAAAVVDLTENNVGASRRANYGSLESDTVVIDMNGGGILDDMV